MGRQWFKKLRDACTDPVARSLRRQQRVQDGQLETALSGYDAENPDSCESLSKAWERLKRTNDILGYWHKRGSRVRSRFMIPALLLAIAGVVGILLSRRLESITAEVRTRQDSVRFGLAGEAILGKQLTPRVLVVEGDLRLLGKSVGCHYAVLRSPNEDSLFVDESRIPGDAVMALDYQDSRLKLTLQNLHEDEAGSVPAIKITLLPGVQLCGCDSSSLEPITDGCWRAPGGGSLSLALRPHDREISFTLERKSVPKHLFETPMTIRSFEALLPLLRQEGTARAQSAILSGVVYFDGLDGVKRELREGQRLTMALGQDKPAMVENLLFEEGGVNLRMRGRVNAVQVESGEKVESLMPTHFEALAHNNALLLLYSGVGWIFAMLVAIRRWWG